MTQIQAKQQIAKLVEKYKKILDEGKVNTYKEAGTRNEFIEPMFEFLGWDMRNLNNLNEVTTEEAISNKRVDLGFRINGIPQFFLEAKPLKADLDNEDYARQAINYSWNKGVTWAVLTDFECLKIFNALAESRLLSDKLVFELKWDKYLEDFDRLWLLSKESFNENKLDEYAVKYGKKIKKLTVNEKLFKDLTTAREILTKSFKMWNEKVDQETLDEGVQRILDRLVFIRVLEDKGLEPPTLQEILHKWEADKKSKQLFPMLITKFRELNDIYNSNIFTKHPCEDWEEYDDSLKKVILMLYGNNVYEYDFKEIPADILGGVYENYLSYVQSRSDAKGKARAKRKEHGIYYTPKYIVEYIVNNTLGKKLEEVNSMHELKQIKVLDPACGSGSFLTQALETINNKYKDFGNRGDQDTKSEILLSNIYGVDLDAQAVELARLNLLIDALDKKAKLPNLTGNIRQGNSLISGDPKELEKYFGKNYRDLHPFNWDEQFKEVFDKGGFDVVIGNPPYLKERDNKEIFEPIKKSDYKKYYQSKMDFWYFFLHRAIDVCKEGGYIGFITNSYFIKSAGASKLIQRIKNELVLIKAVDLDDIKVFGDVSGRHIIHIYQKRKFKSADKLIYISLNKEKFGDFIDEKNGIKLLYKNIFTSDSKISFEQKESISFKNSIPIGDIYDISQGVVEANAKISRKSIIGSLNNEFKAGEGVFVLEKKEVENLRFNSEEKKTIKKYLNSSNVGKYFIDFNNQFLIYSDKEIKEKIKKGGFPNIKNHLDRVRKFITSSNKPYGLHRPREEKYFENPKLICKNMFLKPEFYYDEDKYYVGFSFSVIIQKDKNFSLKYLLGILNSKLGEYWFNITGKKRGIGVDIGVLVLRKFPVFKASKNQQDKIVKLVDQMLDLNKRLQVAPENSEKWLDLKREIEKLDKKIDEEVYKLYGLREEEIKIVEKA